LRDFSCIPVRPVESIAAGASTAEREGRSAGRIPNLLAGVARSRRDQLFRFLHRRLGAQYRGELDFTPEQLWREADYRFPFLGALRPEIHAAVCEEAWVRATWKEKWLQNALAGGLLESAEFAAAEAYFGCDFREVVLQVRDRLLGRPLSSGGTGGGFARAPGPASLSQLSPYQASGPPPPPDLTSDANHFDIRDPKASAHSEDVVPSKARRWRESIERYESELERKRITKRHVLECARVPRNVIDLLENAELPCTPEQFGIPQLDYLLSGPWSRLEGNTKAYNACLLNRFLKFHGNLTVENAELRFDRTPVRPKDALTRAERIRLLDAARQLGIVPYAMIVLMLTMNLRRSEVLRLKVGQAIANPIVFRGKGREIEQGGGKVRRVPQHPLFRDLLPELLAHRAEIVRGREESDPGFLFCHEWDGRIAPWHKAWVDRQFIIPAFERAGVRRPWNLNHALRRTWVRVALIEQGQPLPVVSELAGHADTRTTLMYAALNDDDRRGVMDSLSDAFGAPLAPKSQGKGGEIGHAV
jgi:integrase